MRIVLLAVGAAVCSSIGWFIYQETLQSATSETKAPRSEVVAVEVVRVGEGTVEDRIDLVGSLEPVTEVAVRSRVDGYLTALPFDIGQLVRKDEVVAELDDRTTQEHVTRAQAVLEIAQAQLAAQAAREAQARREVDRLRGLAKSGVSTEQQEEEALSAWTVAKAEIQLEEARLHQAESDLKQAQLALHELELRSPLTGYIAERNVDVGDLARAEDVLVRVVDLSRIRTIVNVVERDYPKIQSQQTATIEVDALPGHTFDGVVVQTAPVLNRETRTAQVYIEIDNPECLLKPGMHARVRIVASRVQRATLLPSTALLEAQGQRFVYVTDPSENVAHRRDIRTGIRDGDAIQVLTGLQPGEQIVTLGSRLVEDGSAVAITAAEWDCPNVLPLSAADDIVDQNLSPEEFPSDAAAVAPDNGVAGE